MFTKRTIRPERTIIRVDTPSEALAVSIGEHGKVDLPYMAQLLGTPGENGHITTDLSGVIFKDPGADPTDPEAGWQMGDEYLSGDVREKLRMAQFAAETNPEVVVTVDALTKAQPGDLAASEIDVRVGATWRELEASEIDVRLGATWLSPDIVQKFMEETFRVPYYMRRSIAVKFSPHTAEWRIEGKTALGKGDITSCETYGTGRANAYKILEETLNLNVKFSPHTAEWRIEGKTALGKGDITSCETYGTGRANAYKILEETLNLKDIRIYDTIEDAEGKPKRVLNKRETTLAQQKQQAIKDAFANWVWQDPQRRARPPWAREISPPARPTAPAGPTPTRSWKRPST